MISTTPPLTRLKLLCLGILALHGLADCPAATQVSGIIAGQTWTTNGSPYQVNGDLLVASLNIRPGVEVRFMGNFAFEVAGRLNAAGEAGAMIHFRPDNPSTGWQGIFFNESPTGSTLDYCRIEGSVKSGIRVINSDPVIRRSIISNNTTTNNGSGAGIVAELKSGHVIVQSCVITNNRAIGKSSGGGAAAVSPGRITISNSYIAHNSSGYFGGGLWAHDGGQFIVSNSLITSNRSAWGGGARTDGGRLDFRNCTILKNEPDALSTYEGTITVTNSVVHLNGTGEWLTQSQSSVTVAYSSIQGSTPVAGLGNKAGNPVLHPVTFELLQGSPCIDAGNPNNAYNDICFPPSMGGARNDMGVFGGPGACLGVGLGSDDADGDGLPDNWEIEYFGTITSQNAAGDADQDKLTNAGEYKAGTHPTKIDTDGDGYSDFAEIRSQSDPLDPKSIPPADLILTVEQVRLEFVAGMNEKVAIQRSSDLTQWTDVELITGTGEIVTRIYTVSDGQRYFKTVRR
ncbi:MAG: right-handed parallel beta-helix repeat-containing protein [Verrucomicrobiales bacterium]|nr:right-handed parallel beta-helix repeat-containing protein [Verrucomicrobiales bacterium]